VENNGFSTREKLALFRHVLHNALLGFEK